MKKAIVLSLVVALNVGTSCAIVRINTRSTPIILRTKTPESPSKAIIGIEGLEQVVASVEQSVVDTFTSMQSFEQKIAGLVSAAQQGELAVENLVTITVTLAKQHDIDLEQYAQSLLSNTEFLGMLAVNASVTMADKAKNGTLDDTTIGAALLGAGAMAAVWFLVSRFF